MQNPGLDEAQAGIKIAGRNINNFKYADNHFHSRKWKGTKEPMMRVKEELEKFGLKLNIKKLRWHPVPSIHGK